jgi:hypothetical protein
MKLRNGMSLFLNNIVIASYLAKQDGGFIGLGCHPWLLRRMSVKAFSLA